MDHCFEEHNRVCESCETSGWQVELEACEVCGMVYCEDCKVSAEHVEMCKGEHGGRETN